MATHVGAALHQPGQRCVCVDCGLFQQGEKKKRKNCAPELWSFLLKAPQGINLLPNELNNEPKKILTSWCSCIWWYAKICFFLFFYSYMCWEQRFDSTVDTGFINRKHDDGGKTVSPVFLCLGNAMTLPLLLSADSLPSRRGIECTYATTYSEIKWHHSYLA